MIKIQCKELSICFTDEGCALIVTTEIFPPFRLYSIGDGKTIFGADGKSFYLPKNGQYEFDGVSVTYAQAVAMLEDCIDSIENPKQVECYEDLASFPAEGEECVLYIAQDTNTVYVWDGVSYVEISATGSNEVQCYVNLAGFPVVGDACAIYIAEDTNLLYRWDGAAYVEISAAGTASLPTKSGVVAGASFAGAPQTFSVVFSAAFADNDYSVTVTAEDTRTWSVENKSSAGFDINANSGAAISGNVFWQAIKTGEA